MDRKDRIVNWIKIIVILGGIMFWAVFFIDSPEFNILKLSKCQSVYERAFPLADLLLAAVLVLSITPWAYRKKIDRQLSIFAGGQMAFLGVLDLSFNLQSSANILDLNGLSFYLISICCIVFGIILLLSNTRGSSH